MTVLSEDQNAGSERTIISVDAMGGDRGPAAVVAGISRSAKKNPDIGFILHGPKAETGKVWWRVREDPCVVRVEIRERR